MPAERRHDRLMPYKVGHVDDHARRSSGPRRIFVMGATCTGKSAVGARLAALLGGEVISLDSMQVYKGLPVLTAQPNDEEKSLARHHLVDCLDPGRNYDVFSYLRDVSAVLAELDALGRPAVFVGGTFYYFRALVDGFDELPPGSKEERERIVGEYGNEAPALHAALAALDPPSAERIHPNDKKKVIRAIEICRLSGKPMSSLLGGPRRRLVREFQAFSLDLDREELYRRIDTRVDRMMEEGALDEVRALYERFGDRDDLTIHQALGVRQLIPVVRGERSLEEGLSLLKRDTRRFAKRQLSSLRRDARVLLLGWKDIAGPDEMARHLLEQLRPSICYH